MLTSIHTYQFFLCDSRKWLLGPPETPLVETRCHFAIYFTNQFYNSCNKGLKNTSRTTSLPWWHKPPLRTWPNFPSTYELLLHEALLRTKPMLKYVVASWKINFICFIFSEAFKDVDITTQCYLVILSRK